MAFTFGIGTNQTIGNPFSMLDRNRPRKMVFYGRVSTEHEAQLSALENQIQWYDDQAKHHPNWTVVEKYIDEGITGTQAKKRPAFLRMIEDARKGKFDLIVTREVCRFARNTVDTLVTTRELKNIGIEVFFVEDNIWTMDGDGELRLTIMATLAQEESRKVSERVKAGQMISREKRTIYGNGNILGYNREGDTYVINKEQAETVRMIFHMYVYEGMGCQRISKEMEKLGRKNASGLVKWQTGIINRIIINPTYMGYQAYGKSFSNNYLEQKRVFNRDTTSYMYVKADFEPIISEEDWRKADLIRRSRIRTQNDGKKKRGVCLPSDLWTSKLVCKCGYHFRRDYWHKNKSFTTYGYKCYNQINNGTATARRELGEDATGYCDQPTIPDWKLDMMASMILEELWGDRKGAVELAFNLIRDSYRAGSTSGGVTSLPNIISEIDKLKVKRQNLLNMRSEKEIGKEEFLTEKARIDSELVRLEEKCTSIQNGDDDEGDEGFDWIGLKEKLYEIADRKKSMKEIMKKLVYRVVPEDKTHFTWYLKLEPDDDLITQMNMECEGRSGKAVVNISKEGTGNRFPLPLHRDSLLSLRKLSNDIQEATDRKTRIPIQQLPVAGRQFMYFSFVIDHERAKAFRRSCGYDQAQKKWEDIRVEVFI